MTLRERIDRFPTQLWLTVLWVVMMPVATITGWIYSVAFVSVVSIYANAASHWAAHKGDKAQRAAQHAEAQSAQSGDVT